MGALSGKHALITGGGTGIGAAIARALSKEGASLSLVGRRQAPLDAMAAELPRTKAIVADITSDADCAAMVTAANAAHGPIDGLDGDLAGQGGRGRLPAGDRFLARLAGRGGQVQRLADRLIDGVDVEPQHRAQSGRCRRR